MSQRPEPDDVDLFVGGVTPDAETDIETTRFIEESRKRPEYRRELEEARRMLAAIGIEPPDYGIPDARALLEHWRECVAELRETDPGASNGTAADREAPEVHTDPSRETRD